MLYPIVYDKFETDFSHFGLAVLEDVYDYRIVRRVNGEYTCSFRLPLTDEKYAAVAEENLIKAGGQLFTIRVVEPSRSENDDKVVYVEAEHISYELLTEYVESIALTSASPNIILAQLLAGTRFSGSATALSGTHDFTVTRESVMWGLNHLVALADCELHRDNFTIDAVPQLGGDHGVQFRYRKNLRGIKRTADTRGVITRLYAYGKDGLTIPPIDSPNIGLYPRPRIGKVEFNEITTQAGLQAAAERYLDLVDNPRVTYEVSVVELKDAIGYDAMEAFELGDTVGVYDEELGLALTARIMEYEEMPLEPESSRVVLANFIETIEDTLGKLQDAANRMNNVLYKGKVNTYWLDGAINAIVNQIKMGGAYQNATEIEGQGFLLENDNESSPDFGALYIGPGWLLIASEKLPNGTWKWRTALTGQSVNADEIRAGTLQASLVKIIGDSHFYWDDTSIYIINPNQPGQQIRIGKYNGANYGIGFTTDGGETWSTAIDFAGITIGPNSTFAPGYDPSAALAAAQAAQETAGAAQSAANNALQPATLYNGVQITPVSGLVATRTDNKARSIFNATNGIKIQKGDGAGNWADRLSVDTDGNLLIQDAKIEVTHANGSKTVIDGESFRAYMDADDPGLFVGIDSLGIYRSYNGHVTRFRDALYIGNHTITQNLSGTVFTTRPYSSSLHTLTVDLIGGEWIGKAGQIQVTYSVSSTGSGSSDYTTNENSLSLQSTENIANGVRLTFSGWSVWFKTTSSGTSGGQPAYDGRRTPLGFSLIVIG